MSVACLDSLLTAGPRPLDPAQRFWSALAADVDGVDAGLVGARAVGRQLGEPDEQVAGAHRGGQRQLDGPAPAMARIWPRA